LIDVNNIFSVQPAGFDQLALDIFRYQYAHCAVYRDWCKHMQIDAQAVDSVASIPFLPISFFKTHEVIAENKNATLVFESSGTGKGATSKHYVADVSVYTKSFMQQFERMFGSPKNWCILSLLPAYLERKGSSLVMMAEVLMQESGHTDNGFYLYDFPALAEKLQRLNAAGQKVLLLGVSFALMDFAEAFPMQLPYTLVMETGGMKGRKEEITRQALHDYLCKQLGLKQVATEYGMTELLSQAYAEGEGFLSPAPWMRAMVRDESDPLLVQSTGRGILNIIDLANIHSCAFIATEDAGVVYADGRFEVLGRVDNSDIRGCSLLAV
jgi:phenylacetate-coenzyme A ligase PaaK-like adenylate-forming protein